MKNRIFFLIIAAVLVATGCKEIIAKNITSELPVLIVPSVNDTIQFNPVQFKWEPMDGVTKYRLQVVTPGFSNIAYFTLDTVVTGTEFYAALDSAQYQLKLTALNAGYESQVLGPITFWVGVQPSSGTGTSVSLTSPLAGAYKQENFTGPFEWSTVASATSYEFSLRQGNVFATGNPIHFQNNISTSIINLPSSLALGEGEYSWGVKAYLSNGTETGYSTRTFAVDVTNPNTPAGTFTPSGTFETGTVTFSWNNGIDPGVIKAPVTSVLQIASDSGFSTIWEEESVQGNTAAIDMSSAPVGVYYWRVYNTDAAGNSSTYSTTNQFTLN